MTQERWVKVHVLSFDSVLIFWIVVKVLGAQLSLLRPTPQILVATQYQAGFACIPNDKPYFHRLFRWKPWYPYSIDNADGQAICWTTRCWGNGTRRGTLVWYVSLLVTRISQLRWPASSIDGLMSSLQHHQSTYIHLYIPCTAALCLCRFSVDAQRDFWVNKVRYCWWDLYLMLMVPVRLWIGRNTCTM